MLDLKGEKETFFQLRQEIVREKKGDSFILMQEKELPALRIHQRMICTHSSVFRHIHCVASFSVFTGLMLNVITAYKTVTNRPQE